MSYIEEKKSFFMRYWPLKVLFLWAIAVIFALSSLVMTSSAEASNIDPTVSAAAESMTTSVRKKKKRKKRKVRRKKRKKRRKKRKKRAAKQEKPDEETPAATDEVTPAANEGITIDLGLGGDEAAPAPAAKPETTEGQSDDAKSSNKDAGGFSLDLSGGDSGNSGDGGGDFVIDLGGGLDLGSGEEGFTIDFSMGEEGEDEEGIDFGAIDLSDMEIKSQERERFEAALEMAKNEDWDEAAMQFYIMAGEDAYAEFQQELDYQLAKALYKLGLYHPALERFKKILHKGPQHARYKTTIEWVFFISRKLVDQSEVLKELAKFRNVSWPKQYRNEYRFLLAKYMFIQGEQFEMARMKDQELQERRKKRKSAFDFAEFEEQADDWGETFVIGGDDEEEGMDFNLDEMNFKEEFSFDMETMGAETAPLPTTAKEAINLAIELLEKISERSRFRPRAKYLSGLLSYLSGEHNDALNDFREAIRLLNPRKTKFVDPYLREMAFLSIARVHYEHKQFRKSTFYYNKIDRNSENWLTSLFESSWAYFQIGDYEKALGNLVTLHSPFFTDEYFPESQVLRAVIYFENCRYPETRDIVSLFIKTLKPVQKHIQALADTKDAPDKLYEKIDELMRQSGRRSADDMTTKTLNVALMDKDIRTAREKVLGIDDEIESLEDMSADFRASPLFMTLNEELRTQRLQLMQAGGRLVKERFKQEATALKNLIGQAFIIRMEVAKRERETLRKKMRGEELDVIQRPYATSVAVDDEHLYWPYEDEYWRDELGTYEYSLSWGCR